jgi:hypothetical protein
MALAQKRNLAEAVRRLVSGRLRERQFVRGKTSYWSRLDGPVIEFIHLHLFSYSTSFRVEPGIRVLNDSFDAIALNGPVSQDSHARFGTSEASVAACAESIVSYVADVAEPWFERWRDRSILGSAPDSPLGAAAMIALKEAMAGRADSALETRSKGMLGAA